MNTRVEAYLSGNRLWGDDFSQKEIEAWFKDESEGYYGTLNITKKEGYNYGYTIFNVIHGFSNLPKNKVYPNVLSVGGAFGDELFPVLTKTLKIWILEPSERFTTSNLKGKPLRYLKPEPSGKIKFRDESFDMVTCFGVLHHIPNVTFVISELYRVLRPGGYLLLREPIVSLGDWRKPREGMTKRERGIPLKIMDSIICDAGFKVRKRQPCMNTISYLVNRFFKLEVFNNKFLVFFDMVLSKLFLWGSIYHTESRLRSIRNTSVFYVLQK